MSKHPSNTLSLVADIGGTNTRVALAKGAELLSDTVRRYRNAEYSDLETVLRQYISDEDNVDCKGACIALAGPVRDGVGTMTNLNWTIDTEALKRATGAETAAILNDLQAQGHALGHISADHETLICASQTNPPEDASRLVIGVGTGFNAAPVHETPAGRFVAASESGHANLPVDTEDDLKLSQFIAETHGFAAIEDVLSGRGIEGLYRFHSTQANAPTNKSAADIMAAAEQGDDPIALQTVETFVQTLGTVAGNLALTHLPFGGIYLVGGVARAMASYLDRFGFKNAFQNKGRFEDFLQSFAISTIEDDYAALAGCASHLQERTP